jgi:hypothetical protein
MASPEAGRAGPIDFIGRVQESRVFEGLVDEASHDCPLIFPTKPLDVLWEINGKIGKYSSFSSVVPIQEPAAKRSNSGATATATTTAVPVCKCLLLRYVPGTSAFFQDFKLWWRCSCFIFQSFTQHSLQNWVNFGAQRHFYLRLLGQLTAAPLILQPRTTWPMSWKSELPIGQDLWHGCE